jgi:hypothetical protein
MTNAQEYTLAWVAFLVTVALVIHVPVFRQIWRQFRERSHRDS